jgi:S-adenosylmethionine:tRNA ribosyltransferase-isomerase
MKLELFDFDLPRECIANRPAEPRDAARLLDLTGAGFADRGVMDLPALLQPGDLMISNDTRVIPARLRGTKGEARIEATLHKQESLDSWRAFARPGKRLKVGSVISFAPGFEAEVVEKGEGGEVLLRFSRAGADLVAALEEFGEMPLPPYIERESGSDARDAEDYQTIFARHKGAVAAPTAGLHFTPRLLDAIAARGVKRATVTLHVGAGTFLPVKVEDTDEHKMHSEWGSVPAETAALIAETRAAGRRIVAVGTTTLRTLEAAAGAAGTTDGTVPEWAGDIDLFITPGYRFRAVDVLLTNFHLPKSTLFMLVSAFSGLERMQAAYAHAISAGYRFFSYGDACLLSCESKMR